MFLFNSLVLRSGAKSWCGTSSRTALLVAASLAAGPVWALQAPPAESGDPNGTAAHKPHHHHVKAASGEAAATNQTPPPAPELTAQEAPQIPQWPVNEAPGKPQVTWDSQGLKIDAANSSLHQILDDVSTATGAKVEGMGPDERVFGEFGPGDARDVLSQLLHGSSYNVLMIGDQGGGTPREIVLSTRHAGNPSQAANRPNQDMQDEDTPEPEPEDQGPPPPPMMRPPMPQGPPGAAGTPRTPQQLLQELQQRQQEMQNQQIQNQQGVPQQQPVQPPQQQ